MIDPIAFHLGPLAVHWYGISYGISLGVSLWILIRLNKKRYLFKDNEQIFDFIFWIFLLGVILGGRLGYVLFYNFSSYLQRPLDIFKVWEGGMSFHGGLIGALLVGYFYAKKHRIDYLKMADLVVIPGALATSFGRVANFINQELLGRPIESEAWQWLGVNFGDGILRWPSQLFQAAEGVLIFLILLWVFKKSSKKGVVFASYFILQGAFRFFTEFFRMPDAQIGFQALGLTRGQWLSLVVALSGVMALRWIKGKEGEKASRFK